MNIKFTCKVCGGPMEPEAQEGGGVKILPCAACGGEEKQGSVRGEELVLAAINTVSMMAHANRDSIKDLKILRGWDFGRPPAVVLSQLDNRDVTMGRSLSSTAEAMVGDIGQSTKTSTAINGEKYVTCSFTAKFPADVWKGWVRSYIHTTRLIKPQGRDCNDNPPLRLYWRYPPVATPKGGGAYSVFARLLISWAPG